MKIDKEEDLNCENNFEFKKILMTMPKEDVADRFIYRYDKIVDRLAAWLFILALIALVFGGFVGYSMGNGLNKDTQELGQAICEGEYGMDYDGYNDKVLRCKQKEMKIHYDGIEVEIGGK